MFKDRLIVATVFAYLAATAGIAISLQAQTTAANEWTWAGGNNSVPNNTSYGWPGTYGTLGTPSRDNLPGSRKGATTWRDQSGHLWLFGGVGIDASGMTSILNDLWKFDPATQEWAWMSGSSIGRQMGVYGTQGIPDPANVPGGRSDAAGWIDAAGNLWLYGGSGSNPSNEFGIFNDLWMFSVATNQWTWIAGCEGDRANTCNQYGTYGTLGTPSAANSPGARAGASAWTDKGGKLWLFGGWGVPLTNTTHQLYGFSWGPLNDLWQFDPSTSQWTWMAGSYKSSQAGSYGSLGVPSTANIPDSRSDATSLVDAAGNFWFFGGEGIDARGYTGIYNDLWKFNPSSLEWTWWSGSAQQGATGTYGAVGIPSASNAPGSRQNAAGWIDHYGRLWFFGGIYLDSNQNSSDFDDLWMFDPSTSQWTWMSGPNAVDPANRDGWPGVYGSLGTPDAANTPGARNSSATWIDESGNLWLFGGFGVLPSGRFTLDNVYLNDLWEFQPSLTPPSRLTPTVTASPSPTTINASQDLIVSVTVNGADGKPIPTGSVSVQAGTYNSNYAALVAGKASVKIPGGSLQAGTISLRATYTGDGIYIGAVGTASVVVATGAGFTLSMAPNTLTVTRGSASGNTSTVTISPIGGFTDNVLLTASFSSYPPNLTAQQMPTAIFTPGLVTVGSGASTSTLTISTRAPVSATLQVPSRPASRWYSLGTAALACILFFGIPNRRRWRSAGMLALLVFLICGVISCGGGQSSPGKGSGSVDPGTAVGSYLIDVDASPTSGSTGATSQRLVFAFSVQ